MEMSPGYKFDLGDRVIAKSGHYSGQIGSIISRRRGFGTPAYTVDFGQGSCLIVKEEELSAATNQPNDAAIRE